ncbi:hypothetical protein ACFSHR_27080 [Azotobacter chroococcum]
MIKYKADDWLRPKVEIVECERATDSSVFVNGKRRAKESANERYLDSFDEAKSWLWTAPTAAFRPRVMPCKGRKTSSGTSRE